MPPLEHFVSAVCVTAASLFTTAPAVMILRKPCGVREFSYVCVRVIKAVCAVKSCMGGEQGGQEAQTFIKPQHHHLPGVLGVPSGQHARFRSSSLQVFCKEKKTERKSGLKPRYTELQATLYSPLC